MDEFELALTYNGKELTFPVQLLNYGTSYKLQVEIEGTKVFFEPDEERNWRAVLSYEDVQGNKKLNVELLQAITGAIDAILQ